MSTHATIGLLNPAGSVDFIYRKHDGHPAQTGVLLHAHYSDPHALSKLIALGTVKADVILDDLEACRGGYVALHLNKAEHDRLVRQETPRHHAEDLAYYKAMALKMHVHYMYLLNDKQWLVSEKRRPSPEQPWQMTEATPLEEWLGPSRTQGDDPTTASDRLVTT